MSSATFVVSTDIRKKLSDVIYGGIRILSNKEADDFACRVADRLPPSRGRDVAVDPKATLEDLTTTLRLLVRGRVDVDDDLGLALIRLIEVRCQIRGRVQTDRITRWTARSIEQNLSEACHNAAQGPNWFIQLHEQIEDLLAIQRSS